jgi:16S rRNA (adenine1518-N6/adenine1519-N6)-dimethyltransferase
MHVPRKRFGQNFLEDHAVVERIVEAIRPCHGERMVEIGPGLGALTSPLLQAVDRLDVVEIDRDIVRSLRSHFSPEKLSVHEGDALETDFGALGPGLRVVGNLPYNISTPILFHLSTFVEAIRDCHFMLQREVVQRMGAQPGTAEYGRLSVMLQYRWQIEPLFDVAPTSFNPPPKVWSSLVRMTPYASPPIPARDERSLAKVVTAAFGQRRKTLRNALAFLVSTQELVALGIDPGVRGETLGVASFVLIANHLADRGN